MESTQRKYLQNPRENANCLSQIFFAWTVPFFKMGYETMLKLEDTFGPMTCDKSKNLGDRLEA